MTNPVSISELAHLRVDQLFTQKYHYVVGGER